MAVYKFLQVPEELCLFEESEIKGEIRAICLHVCCLPDVFEDCLNESSAHFLVDWLERLCEIYIEADYAIDKNARPKVDLVMKIMIEVCLEIIGIDITKIYSA